MTKVPDRLGSRMCPRINRKELEEIYSLGEYDFEDIETDQKLENLNPDSDSFDIELWYRLAGGYYGEYEDFYEGLVVAGNETSKFLSTPDSLWNVIEVLIDDFPYDHPLHEDDDFVSHLENQLGSPDRSMRVSEDGEDALELWIRYLLDRGLSREPDPDGGLFDDSFDLD
jgi:hypothetical protein